MTGPEARPGESPENARAVAVAAEAGITVPYLASLTVLCRDQLVAFRPAGAPVEVTNDKGTDTALPCRILVVTSVKPTDPPKYDDLGVREVFWRVVRQAVVANTSNERPWHAGRLRRMGGQKPYMELRPPTPEEVYTLVSAVTAFVEVERQEGQLPVGV